MYFMANLIGCLICIRFVCGQPNLTNIYRLYTEISLVDIGVC